LERRVRDRGAAAPDVERARIVLLSTQGLSGPEVADRGARSRRWCCGVRSSPGKVWSVWDDRPGTAVRSAFTEEIIPVRGRPGTNRVQTAPPNTTRRSRRPSVVPTANALVSILPAALHQQTQPGPGTTCPRRAGRPPGCRLQARAIVGRVDGVGHPLDLPRATTRRPEGRATRRLAGPIEGCPRDAVWSGSARPTGCPTAPARKIESWGRRRAVERREAVRNLEK
jgi:hypothetical protein